MVNRYHDKSPAGIPAGLCRVLGLLAEGNRRAKARTDGLRWRQVDGLRPAGEVLDGKDPQAG